MKISGYKVDHNGIISFVEIDTSKRKTFYGKRVKVYQGVQELKDRFVFDEMYWWNAATTKTLFKNLSDANKVALQKKKEL